MATGDTRQILFTDSSGFEMTLLVTENADGTLTFEFQVDETTGQTGDVRAIYLNNTDDTYYSGLHIVDADTSGDTTDLDMVQDIDSVRIVEEKDTNVNGEVLKENDGKFDTGIEFGSSGMAVDDVQTVTFTLSADQPLSIDSFDYSTLGLRVTSTGDVDGSRNGSLKLTGTEVETENVLSDDGEFTTVNEDSGVTVLDNVLLNAVDPEAGDPVVVSVGTASHGGLFTINADGSASFDTNGDFEDLAAGVEKQTSVTYTIRDAAGDEVTSTYTVTVVGVNDLDDDDEATMVMEGSGENDLVNVLANTFDPEAGDPTVVDVDAPTVVSLSAFSTASVESTASTGIVGMNGGLFYINADGTATFDTNGEFEYLAEGETAVTSVDYTVQDSAGDEVTSTYTVTVMGTNDAPVALDDLLVTDEGVSATINILGNDSDPDGDAISIVSVNGASVGQEFSVTTDAGRTGTVVVDASGNLTFTPDSSFDDLNDLESDTVSFGYSITDGQLTSDANVTVVVNGSGSAGGKVTFNGAISTALDNSTHVVAIIDTNQFTTGIAFGATTTDVDGDGNYGTMVDLMISKVIDMAGTLAATDKVTLVPSGFDGMGGDIPQAFTFSAGDLAGAANDPALLQNMLLQFVQTYNGMDFAIDLTQGLATAEAVFLEDSATQNEVIVLTSSESFDPDGSDMAASAVEASADADIDVLYIEAGFYANTASLSSIDSDTTVDVDPGMNFGLSQLIEPAPEVLATVEEFTISVDGAAVDGIDVSSLAANQTGDGFVFNGDVDLSGLSGEIDIVIAMDTDNDPTSAAEVFRLSDSQSVDERTVADGDTFNFDFDQVFV